jgi:hypothetical protein
MTIFRANGRYLYWAFIILLIAFQVYANFGPPPSSPDAMAVTALLFYLVLALLAGLVERFATAQGPRAPLFNGGDSAQ